MKRSFCLIGVVFACVLLYSSPVMIFAFTSGEAASLVLGQSSFTTNTPATSQTGMHFPSDVKVGPSGNIWVVDSGNNRVLQFLKGSGFKNGQAASLVLGQSTFTSNTAATSQSGMNEPSGVASILLETSGWQIILTIGYWSF